MIGPTAGPRMVVIAHSPMARGRSSGGNTRINKVCDIGINGLPQMPWPKLAEHQHVERAIRRTGRKSQKPTCQNEDPHRSEGGASHPVNGTQIASATA